MIEKYFLCLGVSLAAAAFLSLFFPEHVTILGRGFRSRGLNFVMWFHLSCVAQCFGRTASAFQGTGAQETMRPSFWLAWSVFMLAWWFWNLRTMRRHLYTKEQYEKVKQLEKDVKELQKRQKKA